MEIKKTNLKVTDRMAAGKEPFVKVKEQIKLYLQTQKQMESRIGIEPTYPVWKTGIITIMLTPHRVIHILLSWNLRIVRELHPERS